LIGEYLLIDSSEEIMERRQLQNRRTFLKNSAGFIAAAPFISRLPRADAAARKFDPNFGTASEAVRALKVGIISSRELTGHVYSRIKKYNPKINAFVTLIEEQAMARAKQADEALAAKKVWGPLHGLPILIKDGFATAGVRTTAGSKRFENYVPKEDAVAVARLKQTGAIIIGKTNVPEFLLDWQSYNEIVGTTNNPWDVARTPGGSTGGGAAALAAGFGFLELGSDLGGSIRVPSHFCGVYGHKPSLDVVPRQGHIPPLPGVLRPDELSVAGPLARSAQDLRLELEIIGGPSPLEAIAYRWSLPPARRSSLKEYRIGYVLDDSFCPLDSSVAEVLSSAIEALRKQGVKLTEGWPPGIEPQAISENYIRLLAAFLSTSQPEEALKQMQESLKFLSGQDRVWAEGTACSHRDWLIQSTARLKAQEAWQEYFKTHDAFLMPTNFVSAFPHDHSPQRGHRLTTSHGERRYDDQAKWISFATVTGCPATVAPVGRTKSDLPVGIQIMGPLFEDATPIDIAGRMADVVGGFEAPPGYAE
jgi:amidase